MPEARYWGPARHQDGSGTEELMRAGPSLLRSQGFHGVVLELQGYSGEMGKWRLKLDCFAEECYRKEVLGH